MAKIPLGGVKVLNGRSCLTSFSRPEDRLMPGMCQRLAMEQVNVSLLAYLQGNQGKDCVASFCTEDNTALSAYFLLHPDSRNAVQLQSDLTILSIFPYHEMAEIAGMLVGLMACTGVAPHALASSLSALSVAVPSSEVEFLIDGLFDGFEFPGYKSIADWYAAYEGQERLLKQIVCSYREEIVKVYNLVVQAGLDLWALEVPTGDMDRLATFLAALGELDIKVPYMTVQERTEEILLTACCLDANQYSSVARIAERHLRDVRTSRLGPVAAFTLHGPHFGDRYGIADALTGSLQKGLVQPLALSCAVSSVSVLLREEDLDAAVGALKQRFAIPDVIRI